MMHCPRFPDRNLTGHARRPSQLPDINDVAIREAKYGGNRAGANKRCTLVLDVADSPCPLLLHVGFTRFA
jgi:hypothetical protein